MKLRSSRDVRAASRRASGLRALAAACVLSAGLAYLGCSSDDSNTPLNTFDGGAEGSVIGDGGTGDGGNPTDAGPCPEGGTDEPTDLRCTGLYSDWASKTVDPNNISYAPGVILWADGADKGRWLYLPPGTKIDTSDMDQWSFPVGTKVWKEFSFSGKKIETRYFEKTGVATIDGGVGQWIWGTYQWSDDQSTALEVKNGVDDAGPNDYYIPSHGDCNSCHNGGKRDRLLGVEAIGLGIAGATGETLAQLQTENRFTTNPPSTTVNIPDDTKGSVAALGYLHMNCGVTCHNDNPNALCVGSGLFMRLSATAVFANQAVNATPTYTTAVGVPPSIFATEFPDGGWERIKSGHPEQSEIPTLDSRRGTGDQMPPLATHIPDEAGIGLVNTWIANSP
ncbi:MAG: hypothetical protein ACRELY_30275 [Polyangiaceae bacterium]